MGARRKVTQPLGHQMAQPALDLITHHCTPHSFGYDETRFHRLSAGVSGSRDVYHYAAPADSPAAAHSAGEVTASPKPVRHWQHMESLGIRPPGGRGPCHGAGTGQ